MNRQKLKHEVFMNIAEEVSRLSHDKHTKVGCVITDQEYRIISTGFNGLPSKWTDSIEKFLERPLKYTFMSHAESNCIHNAKRDLEDSIAFITHYPCIGCLIDMWQSGVKTVYHLDKIVKMLDNEEYWENLATFKKTLEPHGFKMEIIKV